MYIKQNKPLVTMVDALSNVAVDTVLTRVALVGLVVLPTVVRSSLLVVTATNVFLTLVSVVRTVVWWFIKGVFVVDDGDVVGDATDGGCAVVDVVLVCFLGIWVTVVRVVFTTDRVDGAGDVNDFNNVVIRVVVVFVGDFCVNISSLNGFVIIEIDVVIDDVKLSVIVSERETQCTADMGLLYLCVLMEFNCY